MPLSSIRFGKTLPLVVAVLAEAVLEVVEPVSNPAFLARVAADLVAAVIAASLRSGRVPCRAAARSEAEHSVAAVAEVQQHSSEARTQVAAAVEAELSPQARVAVQLVAAAELSLVAVEELRGGLVFHPSVVECSG